MGPSQQFESWSAEEILAWAIRRFGPSLAIATSFQKEGMVLLDMGWRISPAVRVFTLDTGFLPAETIGMIETVRKRYGISVETVRPDPDEVRAMVAAHGEQLFLQAVPLRRLCCQVRKVRPLDGKLATLAAWVTGLRRVQHETRAGVPKVDGAGTLKISPLADWSEDDVERYTREHDVPVHPLYAQGYTSIGCATCTRAVRAGEDPRAGRWWWEEGAAKECGIHFSPDGRLERQMDVLLRDLVGGKRG